MAISKKIKLTTFLFTIAFSLNFQLLQGTALIEAVKDGDYDKVEKLLKNGALVDETDKYGNTAVIWAALTAVDQEGMKILALILQYHPDLNKLINDKTALMHAIDAGNWKAAELIIAHHPDLNKKNSKGETVQHKVYVLATSSSGETKEAASKFVPLLLASLLSNMSMVPKSCFLSFEQNDFNGAIAENLQPCLDMKMISIVAPRLLQTLFKKFETVSQACRSGKLTFLASKFKLSEGLTPQLIVIIPESLEMLGIIIPESEKQKVMPLVDISSVENKFGFKNLTLINPEYVISVVEKSPTVSPAEILANFPAIINTGVRQHPTRFYLAGHGSMGIIAAIPILLFKDFLAALSEINAEFVYINSCEAAANLPQIQVTIADIITKQIEERKKSKTAPFPGIDYAIVIQATADVPTTVLGNINAMFSKLDEFLAKPVWALEFGPGVKKPKITITDVISALGRGEFSDSLPSIRMPGKTGFFRSVNIGNMEIITESRLIELGVKKSLKLIEESKSADKNISEAAKKKLKENLDIEIVIKSEIKDIQIFPGDLFDFTFVLQGRPKIISKLTGRGQHYIGKVIVAASSDIDAFAIGFADIFSFGSKRFGYKADRCWFIKFVDVNKNNYKKLAIYLYVTPGDSRQHVDFAYINENDKYILSGLDIFESKIDKKTFESTVRKWFEKTIPSQEILTEATGGVEITAEEKVRLLQEKGGKEALKLLEPKFARTPQDLFNMFMAD